MTDVCRFDFSAALDCSLPLQRSAANYDANRSADPGSTKSLLSYDSESSF